MLWNENQHFKYIMFFLHNVIASFFLYHRSDSFAIEALMALAGAESSSDRKSTLKVGPEVVTGIRKLQKPDDEDKYVSTIYEIYGAIYCFMNVIDWFNFAFRRLTILNGVPSPISKANARNKKDSTLSSRLIDEAKAKWENTFDENRRNVQDDYDRETEQYSGMSPVPQITLEHSYSLPPERDPSGSPANNDPHSRKLFNHDHGYVLLQ